MCALNEPYPLYLWRVPDSLHQALQFVVDFHGDSACIADLDFAELDRGIHSAAEEAGDLEIKPPPGMPKDHWWWSPPQLFDLH